MTNSPNTDTVDVRVRRLVAEVLGVPEQQVTAATTSQTIENWDSLAVMNLLMAVEGEFGIAVSPEQAAEFTSVQKIIATVEQV